MTPLRLMSILSNVLFATYGCCNTFIRCCFLHIVLLPVDLWRLFRRPAGPGVPAHETATKAAHTQFRMHAGWFLNGMIAGTAGLPMLLSTNF